MAIGLAVSLVGHGALLAAAGWLWQFRLPAAEMTVTVALAHQPRGIATAPGTVADAPGESEMAAAVPASPAEDASPIAGAARVAASPTTPPVSRTSAKKPRNRTRAEPSNDQAPGASASSEAEEAAGREAIGANQAQDDGDRTTGSAGSTAAASGTEGDSPARPDALGNRPPRYPALARQRKEEGRVVLHVIVDAQGNVASLSVARSSGSRLLDDAAVDAVRRWRFAPARRAGVPVAGSVEVPILFRLTG